VPLAILGSASVVAGLLFMRRANTNVPRHQRQSQLGRWFDRLWQGRFGRWFFAVAQPKTSALLPAAENAPTEILLARAADSLFDALPSSVRAQIGAGRDVIDRLCAQVGALRHREQQLEAALAEAGEPRATISSPDLASTPRTLVDRRGALTNEIEQARREAATRRASAVAALENIRLQLLRLRTGLGSPADLTADLEAAREIERQISAIVEANDIAK
jgi:hypothetical protein